MRRQTAWREAGRPRMQRSVPDNAENKMRLPVTSQLLFYTAAVALVGLIATEARGTPAAWTGSMARDVAAATAESTDAPLILVRRGGGGGGRGGGGFRGGGAGGF